MGKLKKRRPRPARPNPLGVQRNEPNGANGVAVGDVTTPAGKVGGAVKSLVDKVVNFLKIQGLGWGGFLTNCTSLFKSDTYIYSSCCFLICFFFFSELSENVQKQQDRGSDLNLTNYVCPGCCLIACGDSRWGPCKWLKTTAGAGNLVPI